MKDLGNKMLSKAEASQKKTEGVSSTPP